MEDLNVSPTTRVRPKATAKVIDGEAIIMNLSNGLYFSMDNVGADVWLLVERRHSASEMAETIAARYNVSSEVTLADVSTLLQELLHEDLVVTIEGEPNGDGPQWDGAPNKSYSAPILNKYSDMADLLALDPPMPGLGDSNWD